MAQSITYYLTLYIIRLKGVKRTFGQDPLNLKKIRKDDVLQPKGTFFKNHIKGTFQIAKSNVHIIRKNNSSIKLMLFLHGGAFISGPVKHH